MTGFYAYVLARPSGIPFYVGKGRGYRLHRHFDRNSHAKNVHAEIDACGGTPTVHKFGCKDEAEAHELERFLIAEIGRRDRDAGPLLNRTSGGQGTSGRHWFRHSEETKARIRMSMLGKKRKPETLERMRAAAQLRMRTEEGQRTIRYAVERARQTAVTPERRKKLVEAARRSKRLRDALTGRFCASI